MVACFPGINSRTSFRHLFSLGMADPDSSFPDDCFCKGHGHHVTEHVIFLYMIVPPCAGLFL